jgi:glycosyltransferase involved in cell wall biosynthesis
MKFSVLICVYYRDSPDYFFDALQSIMQQTILPSEVVLVVDGPVGTDIHAVISETEKTFKNFKIIQLKENVGHGRARQIGIENCSYDFVALMDSDDLCVMDRFEDQTKAFKADNDLSIVGGWINEFSDDILRPLGQRKLPSDDFEIKKYLKYRCPMNQVTVMFKKSDVLDAGGYLDWHHEEDYYLWLRMYLQMCKFKNLQKVLVHVRADKDYFSRRGGMEYFLSEARLQKYMYNNSIINTRELIMNISVRFLIQVAVPNTVRRFIFIFLRRNT